MGKILHAPSLKRALARGRRMHAARDALEDSHGIFICHAPVIARVPICDACLQRKNFVWKNDKNLHFAYFDLPFGQKVLINVGNTKEKANVSSSM